MVKERNKEIEAIIEKLGDETHSTQKQIMAQYEQKLRGVQTKHNEECKEFQRQIKEFRDRYHSEVDIKTMLDDNLKVLSRRINDLEIELQDKKDKIKIVQKQNEEIQHELQAVYDKEGKARNEIVSQMRGALEEKDCENALETKTDAGNGI